MIFVHHKIIAIGLLATTTGVAIYSSWKLWRLKRKKVSSVNVYESGDTLGQYLTFHYGSQQDMVGPWTNSIKEEFLFFPKRCADICIKYGKSFDNVLDIGCAVGRSSFELARRYDHVLGIDFSYMFIKTCNILKEKGSISYSSLIEGELFDNRDAIIDPKIDRSRTHFQQGDACALPLNLGQFDCVLAANLICRLKTPKNFLYRLPQLVKKSGILVITTPYTFLTSFTPRENWIGGFKSTGGDYTGFDGVNDSLSKHFDLIDELHQPMIMKDTKRLYHLAFVHIQIWEKKS